MKNSCRPPPACPRRDALRRARKAQGQRDEHERGARAAAAAARAGREPAGGDATTRSCKSSWRRRSKPRARGGGRRPRRRALVARLDASEGAPRGSSASSTRRTAEVALQRKIVQVAGRLVDQSRAERREERPRARWCRALRASCRAGRSPATAATTLGERPRQRPRQRRRRRRGRRGRRRLARQKPARPPARHGSSETPRRRAPRLPRCARPPPARQQLAPSTRECARARIPARATDGRVCTRASRTRACGATLKRVRSSNSVSAAPRSTRGCRGAARVPPFACNPHVENIRSHHFTE